MNVSEKLEKIEKSNKALDKNKDDLVFYTITEDSELVKEKKKK